jgi:hypothetical protein
MSDNRSPGNLRIHNAIIQDNPPTILVKVYEGGIRKLTKTGEKTTLLAPNSTGRFDVKDNFITVVVQALERKDLLEGEIAGIRTGTGTKPVKLVVEIDDKRHRLQLSTTTVNM